ncbi:MAG: carbonic anhydrase [Bdellovibrionaceae bacterium]|nr:carbonic anhydrase [Pseudobdellovibrionaceae bacterium]
MRKLIKGILDFRKNKQQDYREKVANLVFGQSPDSLLVACSDSRVVPNVFASTDPGDMFVVRNVGNLIPPCHSNGETCLKGSEPAAIDFSLFQLNVSEMIICGHSECGAMQAIINDPSQLDSKHLQSWLANGFSPQRKDQLSDNIFKPPFELSPHNQLSQLNVLWQIEHLKSYPEVQKRLAENKIRLHGWWFDIASADVYSYSWEENKFNIIDETEAGKILSKLK